MLTAIDPTPYLRPPRLDAPSAIALGKMMREARPHDLPAPARQSGERLDESVKALEGAWQESERTGPREADMRPYDKRLDNAWSATNARLGAYKTLPEGALERQRAEAIGALLFPQGLTFLKAPYLVEHTESQRRLDLVAAEGLGDELRALVGPLFVDELAAAHEAYGKALGITAALEAPALPARVAEPLREMQIALRSYTLQLLAHAETGDEALAAVGAALRPLDLLRARVVRRAARGGVVEPEAPVEAPSEAPAGEAGGEGVEAL